MTAPADGRRVRTDAHGRLAHAVRQRRVTPSARGMPSGRRRRAACTLYAEQNGGPFMTFSGWPTPDVRRPRLRRGRPPAPDAPAGGPIERRRRTASRCCRSPTRKPRHPTSAFITGYPVPELDPMARVPSSVRNSVARRAGATSSACSTTSPSPRDPVTWTSTTCTSVHRDPREVPRPRCRLRDHRGRDARRAGSAGVADRERPRPTRVPTAGLHRDFAVHAVGRPSRRVLTWPARAAESGGTPSARSSTPQPQPNTAPPVGGTTRRSPNW